VRRARAAYLEDFERAVMAEAEGEGWELLDAGRGGVGVKNSGEVEEELGDEAGDQERNESCQQRGGHGSRCLRAPTSLQLPYRRHQL
jgi:hypothetical protein